jgi:hypothetical protein
MTANKDKNDWQFSGVMWFEDTYNFDLKERDAANWLKVLAARIAIP